MRKSTYDKKRTVAVSDPASETMPANPVEISEGDGSGFVPFVGDYEKRYYDVRRVKRRDASGNVLEYEIVPHCWPNAGRLMELE